MHHVIRIASQKETYELVMGISVHDDQILFQFLLGVNDYILGCTVSVKHLVWTSVPSGFKALLKAFLWLNQVPFIHQLLNLPSHGIKKMDPGVKPLR